MIIRRCCFVGSISPRKNILMINQSSGLIYTKRSQQTAGRQVKLQKEFDVSNIIKVFNT